MRQHLDPPPGVRTGRPFDQPEGEPAHGEGAKARSGESPVPQQINHRAGALEGQGIQVHAAARIAQRGIAAGLKRPPDRLAEDMGQRPNLGDEGQPPAPDLADGASAQQHALRGAGPVHPPDLDNCGVPAAIEDVGLGDPVGGEHTLRILCVHGQVGAGSDLGRRQPAFRFELGAVERQRPVVVREAEGHAVRPGDAPAPGQCGGALVQMGLQRGREGLHGLSPRAAAAQRAAIRMPMARPTIMPARNSIIAAEPAFDAVPQADQAEAEGDQRGRRVIARTGQERDQS